MNIINGKINLVHYKNFLSREECSRLINENTNSVAFKRTRSIQHGISDRLTGRSRRLTFAEDLNYKIWRTGLPHFSIHKSIISSGYPLQMLKYEEDEYSSNHLDCLTPEEAVTFAPYKQHIFTFILYLNDDYIGGELEFDKLGMQIKPSAGDAYLWKNVKAETIDDYFIPDELSSHSSLPIKEGTKYNIVKFFI